MLCMRTVRIHPQESCVHSPTEPTRNEMNQRRIPRQGALAFCVASAQAVT